MISVCIYVISQYIRYFDQIYMILFLFSYAEVMKVENA
jgi:hypothetical protein